MASQVKLVYPSMKKEWVRTRIRRLVPGAYEWAAVLLSRRNDARYRRLQGKLFEGLAGLADKPFHVEIETINKCNSTCAFCPVNRDADPRTRQVMSEALFHRIIDELADWGYDRVVNLFSNNEPFLDKRIFAFAEYTRAKLPDAFIQIISNGTALNIDKAERILPFLSRMVINNYGTDYTLHDNVRAIIEHLNAKRPELAGKLVVGLRRLNEFKSNRGGSAPNRKPRTASYDSRCAYPFFQMVIRPDGKVSLCCNDALGQVTLGDVDADSIRAVWTSEAYREVRRTMARGRGGIELCASCDNLSWAKPKRIAKAVKDASFTA